MSSEKRVVFVTNYDPLALWRPTAASTRVTLSNNFGQISCKYFLVNILSSFMRRPAGVATCWVATSQVPGPRLIIPTPQNILIISPNSQGQRALDTGPWTGDNKNWEPLDLLLSRTAFSLFASISTEWKRNQSFSVESKWNLTNV